jgi:phage baseplate assembly protein W
MKSVASPDRPTFGSNIEELSASPHQVSSATVALERMVEVLEQLKRYRARFAQVSE